MLRLDRRARLLADDKGQRFDPAARVWIAGPAPGQGEAIDAEAAVAWVQRESGWPLRAPIGVIGPREATPEQLAAAEEIGARIAAMGLAIVCGGRQGVMEAACRGAAKKGGISVGLLGDTDASQANPFVTVPLATGIGEARNALVARSAFCLVAVGDSYGTLSEVALGLHFGKPLFGIAGAARVDGVRHYERVEDLANAVARTVLSCAGAMA
jgi:uncharacterized protein (TIGR00725 family)